MSDAKFLSRHGLDPVVPLTHSSDYGLTLEDPRIYYLRRRLGIHCPLDNYGAFSIGRKFHSCYEVSLPNGAVDNALLSQISAASDNDIRSEYKRAGISEEKLRDRLIQEDHDRSLAQAFYACASDIPFIRSGKDLLTFHEYIQSQNWKFLGSEIDITVEGGEKEYDDYLPPKSTIRLDRVYYDPKVNQIWIIDPKTTSKTPEVRAQKCRIEFQTRHYMYVLRQALLLHSEGSHPIPAFNDLPGGVSIGGMKHWIIQKPPIIFGSSDRAHRWRAISTRNKEIRCAGLVEPIGGGRWRLSVDFMIPEPLHKEAEYEDEDEAVTALHIDVGKKPEKEYAGDPSLDIYISRCRDWYHQTLQESHPPFEISTTYPLDDDDVTTYRHQLSHIHSHATRPPEPSNFLYNPQSVETAKGISRWAPFHLRPVRDWPEILASGHFIIQHRDPVPVAANH